MSATYAEFLQNARLYTHIKHGFYEALQIRGLPQLLMRLILYLHEFATFITHISAADDVRPLKDKDKFMKLFSTLPIHKALLLAAAALPLIASGDAKAQSDRPQSLVITTGPIPESLKSSVYTRPIEVREITAKEVQSSVFIGRTDSVVTPRVNTIEGELQRIQGQTESLARNIEGVQIDHDARIAEYYASVASINTQLQSGTTPGNPRLVAKLSEAEAQLEHLNNDLGRLNGLALDIADTASENAFLQESIRAAFGLSGAVEEDHVRLAQLEDTTHGTSILIERVLNMVNDSVTRLSAYVAGERQNLRTLSLGVTNGELFARNLSDRPFSKVDDFETANLRASAPVEDVTFQPLNGDVSSAAPVATGPRMLAKVKFDQPNVEFEQPLYTAISDALERFPNARFDLVAVNPTSGNAAQVAIETTRARRNAERVLRALTQQGLPMEKIDLSYSESAEASSSEVHLYLK